MRFLLRLLVLLTLGSFLSTHYVPFIRENLWRVHTTDKVALLNQPLGIGQDHSQGRPAQANLPPESVAASRLDARSNRSTGYSTQH